MSVFTTTPGRIVRIHCPCDLAAMREATRTLHGYLERLGVDSSELAAWELIAAEAGNNAVEYVRPDASHLPVELIAEVTPTHVEVRVLDHTPGFDLPAEYELPDPLSESGRGLYLMATLSDSLEYYRGAGRNCLIIRKQRGVPGQPEEAVAGSVESATLETTLQAMTEELAASYESLSAIFRFTSELNRGGGADFIERWMRELTERSGADWYVLRLTDSAKANLVLRCTSRPDLHLPAVRLPSATSPTAPVEVRAAVARWDVWFDRAHGLHDDDPLTALGSPAAGFAHPIFVGADLEGVLAVGRYTTAHPFTAGQVNIIHTIADFLGIQVRNNRIQDEYLRGRLMTREIEIAANIQRSLLPVNLPEPEGLRLAGHSQSAGLVGGDFYDVLEVGEDGLLCIIADVMGKGVPAAMFSAIFRSQIRARRDLARQPGLFLSWLNSALFEDLDRVEMFVTAQLAFLNTRSRQLSVASAGHCPLLLAAPDCPTRPLAASGLPLGVERMTSYEEQVEELPRGARAVMLTDGLIEAQDAKGNLLGLDPVRQRLDELVRTQCTAETTCAELVELATRFRGSASASDDLTLLVIGAEFPPAG